MIHIMINIYICVVYILCEKHYKMTYYFCERKIILNDDFIKWTGRPALRFYYYSIEIKYFNVKLLSTLKMKDE